MTTRRFAAFLAAAVIAPSMVSAQSTDRVVNLQLRDTRISSVLSLISSQTGASVLGAAGLSGNIDISLTNGTLTEALDAVSRATGLTWRRILAPSGSTATDITRALTDAQASPMSNVVLEEKESSPAKALLSGSVARRLWNVAEDLGLREVYWVYDASSVPTSPRSTTTNVSDTSGTAADETASEEPASGDGVYTQVAKSLSSLDAVDALNVVEQLRQEIVSTMSSYELDAYYGVPSAPAPQVPAAWGPPRVRLSPAPQFNIVNQPSAPWWW